MQIEKIARGREVNNVREEICKCDVTAPQIISGPMVEGITQSSAVIVWDTDEVSDSVVKYGRRAGIFELEEAEVFSFFLPRLGRLASL